MDRVLAEPATANRTSNRTRRRQVRPLHSEGKIPRKAQAAIIVAPGGSVTVRNALPKSPHHRDSVRADPAVHGFESQLKVQDLTDDKPATEFPAQGDRAVVEVVHHLHQRKRDRRIETRRFLSRVMNARPKTHLPASTIDGSKRQPRRKFIRIVCAICTLYGKRRAYFLLLIRANVTRAQGPYHRLVRLRRQLFPRYKRLQ